MSVRSQPNKRSIVGSMGLPRYEKPPEPEWMTKRQQEREAELASLQSPGTVSSNGTSRKGHTAMGGGGLVGSPVPESDGPALPDSDLEGADSPAPVTKSRNKSVPKKPIKAPPANDEASGMGMMGKFKSMTKKKEKAPLVPPDTRRRRYNETFGKKSKSGIVAAPMSNGNQDYGDEDEDDEESELSPQEHRARAAAALQGGDGARAGLAGGIIGTNATTADEVKSQAQARAAAQEEGSYLDEDEDGVEAERPDVDDEESVPAVVNSSSLAPALTGGYLDEKVPSYELTDPSTKDYSQDEKKGMEKKESNGYLGAAAGAVGAVAAGLGLSRLTSSGDDSRQNGATSPNDDTSAPLSPTSEPEELEDMSNEKQAPVAKEKKSRPVKSPKRAKAASKKKAEEDGHEKEAAAGSALGGAAGAAGADIEAEEDEVQEDEGRIRAPATAAVKEIPKRAKISPLSTVQRHYLLKALVSLQMQQEFSELEKLGALTQYGYPFSLERPKLKRIKDKQLEGDYANGDFEEQADDPYADADDDEIRRKENLMEPLICRHMFHVHLHSFPGLDDAPVKYWQKKIQPFFDEMAARNFSHSIERSETSARHFYTLAMTRYLGGFFSRGFGVRGEGELRGPGKGAPGTDRWGKGKEWGKGTVKRGMDRPARPDAAMMDRIDSLFSGKEGEVWKRARKETTRVKRDWQGFKEFCIEKESGLEETMNYLDVGNLRNLPPQYRNAEEYARMHAAYIFHTLFVNSPNAEGFYSILKGIHLLFPYWGAKQMLKVANAQTMIQGILNLLLARPAGAKSLVQRIFVSVIGGQASTINKEYIQPLKKALGEAELCAKLEEYVKRGSRPEGRAIRTRAQRTGQDVVATILLYSSGTDLPEGKKREVVDMHDAFAQSPLRGAVNAAYPSGTPVAKDGKIPQVDNWGVDREEEGMARKYAMLKLYLRELLKRRDREEACKMASGSLVPSIIKESLDTVFYGPIKHIAEVSDLSSRLGDLQAFFDDIIKTKKAGDDSLPAWIALTARHENSLYFLFHECAAIMKPFTEWLQKGADYMALSTTDPAHPANRRAKNIEVNLEEMLRDGRLTDDDVEDIIRETDQLAKYIKWQKIWYELEMRKNFLLARSDAVPASGLSEDDIPKNGDMKKRIQDVNGLLEELMEQEGEEIEDGTVANDARGTEMQDFPWAWFDAADPLHQHLDDTDPTQLHFTPSTATVKMPTLKATRKALEPFRQALVEKMPAWKEGDARGVPATPQALLNSRQKNVGPGDQGSIAPSAARESAKSPAQAAPPAKRGSMFRLPFTGR